MPTPRKPFVTRLLFAALIAANLGTAATMANAAEPSTSASEASNTAITAIKAGRLVDVVNGRVLNDQIILVQGERIIAVGAVASVTVPSNAKVIDLSKATVLPGLIDAHTHITSSPYLHGYSSLSVSGVRAALYGVRAARDTLNAGFTMIRDVGSDAFGDLAVRDAINDGDFPGPNKT